MMLDAVESPALATPFRCDAQYLICDTFTAQWACNFPGTTIGCVYQCIFTCGHLLQRQMFNIYTCVVTMVLKYFMFRRQPKFLAFEKPSRGQSKLVWKNSRRALAL